MLSGIVLSGNMLTSCHCKGKKMHFQLILSRQLKQNFAVSFQATESRVEYKTECDKFLYFLVDSLLQTLPLHQKGDWGQDGTASFCKNWPITKLYKICDASQTLLASCCSFYLCLQHLEQIPKMALHHDLYRMNTKCTFNSIFAPIFY